MTAEKDAGTHHPRCGSIQCAVCYPGWGERYNEAVVSRVHDVGGRVHNHPPYRPVCNERDVDGQLRGACLNDDGTSVTPPGQGRS